jgi:hypothetical protein
MPFGAEDVLPQHQLAGLDAGPVEVAKVDLFAKLADLGVVAAELLDGAAAQHLADGLAQGLAGGAALVVEEVDAQRAEVHGHPDAADAQVAGGAVAAVVAAVELGGRLAVHQDRRVFFELLSLG